jgi:hypothetical protein
MTPARGPASRLIRLTVSGSTGHLPHYSRRAAVIGLTILAITVIAATISAVRSRRRR